VYFLPSINRPGVRVDDKQVPKINPTCLLGPQIMGGQICGCEDPKSLPWFVDAMFSNVPRFDHEEWGAQRFRAGLRRSMNA